MDFKEIFFSYIQLHEGEKNKECFNNPNDYNGLWIISFPE